MTKYREEHPFCAWCGRDGNLDVHHIVPVSVDPSKAGDPANMIMLCRTPACHLVVGHEGNYAERYVTNVREVCSRQAVIKVVEYKDA